MRIGDIIGTVTLNRSHPSLAGGRFKLVVPLSLADLTGQGAQPAEELTLYDELGAGVGSRVALSEGREAAQPFHPEVKPIDAYCAAILDTVNLQTERREECNGQAQGRAAFLKSAAASGDGRGTNSPPATH